jgi:hypothetical protein
VSHELRSVARVEQEPHKCRMYPLPNPHCDGKIGLDPSFPAESYAGAFSGEVTLCDVYVEGTMEHEDLEYLLAYRGL